MSGKIQASVTGQEGRNVSDGEPAWGTVFSVWIEQSELERMLAAYDPNSGTSPGVTDARTVVRPIFNAALAAPPVTS